MQDGGRVCEIPKRHCASCLLVLSPETVKLCGGCKKRAYCSKDCQAVDWSSKKGGGQGHKNWCKLLCGEEDLDWEVAEIPGKGLGLVAKREIPAKFRIMVERLCPKTHPGIQDLMPLNGTIAEKIALNCLGLSDEDESAVCLRLSRANHDCNNNANHFHDETFNVKVLFAERDIKPGEEICINYAPFSDISKSFSATSSRSLLQMKWGIICKQDCFCRNKDTEKLIKSAKELDEGIFRLAGSGKARLALSSVDKLINLQDVIGCSLISRQRTLYDGFQISILEKRSVGRADGFIRKAHEIMSAISHPQSEQNLKYAEYIKNHKNHRNYLLLG